MSCRFPDAANPTQFWELLSAGRSAIREVPPERWSAARIYDTDPAAPGKANTKWGGFLQAPGGFDNEFFRMTAEESTYVDPQQRLILELGWEALEDAGIGPDTLAGERAGVYVGISHNDYERIIYRRLEDITRFHGTGSYQAVAANRLSYFLNLVGPSVAVDSACSSALSALHVACAALRQGELGIALVGAVTYHLTPDETIGLTKGRMLSGQGACRPFDKQADGYVRGEGGGVLVLKRLEDALREGDRIHGVVKGTAINHNGRSNGLSAPSGRALQAVFEQGLRSAGLPASAVTFLETHGTGTKLGDQIELNAIREVYGESGDVLRLGAAKSNVGHLETASGMASLIKVLLAMKHGRIPPNIYPSAPQMLPLPGGSRLAFPLAAADWVASEGARVAAVTSYGFGGANGHVILCEAPAVAPHAPDTDIEGGEPELLCLSARDPGALAQLAGDHAAHPYGDTVRLADICYTAGVGRAHFEWRGAIVSSSRDDLRRQLRLLAAGTPAPQPVERQAKSVFAFGASARAPARFVATLSRRHAAFRQAIEQCHAQIARLAPAPDALVQGRLDGFTLQVALARLLAAWGIEPEAVLGIGDGRVAAAAFADALTLEQAVRLIAGDPLVLDARQPAITIVDPNGAPIAATALADGSYLTDPPPPFDEVPDARRIRIGGDAARLHDDVEPTLLAPADDVQAQEALLGVVGRAYARGARIDWMAFHAGRLLRKATLPTYPFQRSTRWFDESAGAAGVALAAASPMPSSTARAPQALVMPTREVAPDPVGARALELTAWLRGYAASVLDSRLMDERRCMPPHVVLDFGNAGLLGLLVPQRWGGEGLSMRDAVHVFEQIGAIDITLAAFIGVHNVLGVLPILHGGSEELKSEFLPRLAAGRLLGAFAVTEPGAGSNPRGMGATARPAPDGGLRLDGNKTWIGNAAWSGALATFVNEQDANGTFLGISGFLTTPATPGVTQGPEALTMGVRAMVQNEVVFKNARVGDRQRLGPPGEGLTIASETFDVGRLGIGALTVGAMKRCVQLLQRFASRRRISTGLLTENGVYLETLGTVAVRIEMIQAWVRLLARLRDEGSAVPSEAYAIAKIAGTEWLWETVDATMQFMGGRGYIETNLVPQMLRDARLLRIFEGPSEALLAHIGASCAKGRSALIPFLAERFGGPCARHVVEQLESLVQAIGDANVRAMTVDRTACLQQRAGWVQCAGALLCAAEARTQGSTRATVLDAARREFDQTLARTREFLAAPHTIDAADIRAHADALASEIGAVDQRSSAGPDTSLDEFLRPDGAPEDSALPWHTPAPQTPAAPTPSPGSTIAEPASGEGPREAVLKLFARRAHVALHALDCDRPFSEYGIDSVDAVEIAHEIEETLGVALDPTALWNYPTLNLLLHHFVPLRAAVLSALDPAPDAASHEPALAGQQLLDELRKELASDEL